MNVERILQIQVSILAILGSLMLGLSQNAPAFPAIMVVAVLLAVVFSDILRWFFIPRPLANIVILATAFLSLWGFFPRHESGTADRHFSAAAIRSVNVVVSGEERSNLRAPGHL